MDYQTHKQLLQDEIQDLSDQIKITIANMRLAKNNKEFDKLADTKYELFQERKQVQMELNKLAQQHIKGLI